MKDRKERDPEFNQRRHLKHKYGLSLDEFNAMVEAQNGVCAICNQAPKGKGKNSTLHVDHDHETGKVRALLCNRCNLVIGHLEEDPDLLQSAIEYLAHWGQV